MVTKQAWGQEKLTSPSTSERHTSFSDKMRQNVFAAGLYLNPLGKTLTENENAVVCYTALHTHNLMHLNTCSDAIAINIKMQKLHLNLTNNNLLETFR